jgi:hypothetical protein
MRDTFDCVKPTNAPGALACAVALTVAAFAILAITTATTAAAPNLYKVSGIAVDGRGKTAKEARAAAISKGQIIAFGRLLRRLTLKRDHKRLPAPKGKIMGGLIKGHEVESQRAGARRYKGKLAFIFHSAKVQALLRSANVAFIETASKPVLVLAVWQKGDVTVLWDDPNPWREVWRHLDDNGQLVSFLRPGGGLSDIQAVSAQQALSLDAKSLSAIGSKYGAATVLIAHAQVKGARASIQVRRFNTVTGKARLIKRYQSGAGSPALRKVAARIAGDFEEGWKAANIVPAGATSSLTVRAPLEGLSYWVRLRDGLRQVRLIRSRQIVSLTPAMAVIRIGYAGGVRQLTEALRQNDLDLRKGGADGDTEIWELRLTGTGSRGSDGPRKGGDRSRRGDGGQPDSRRAPAKKDAQ